jgi:molybdenum cofactor biosynthesis protein B
LKPHELHRASAPPHLNFYLVTVSTSRYAGRARGETVEDEAGDVAERRIREAGHRLVGRELIPDDPAMLREALNRALGRGDVDVVIFTGGTGISPRDLTIETLRPFFDKELEGFGEILRQVSFQRIGAAALLTRATAGVVSGRLVLCLPGSPDAVETGLEVFMGELPHAVFIARG